MNLSLSRFVLAAVLGLLSIPGAWAAGAERPSTEVADPAATLAYWTADRIIGARAVRLPRVAAAAPPARDRELTASRAAAGKDHPPAEPSAGILPDFARFLFDPGAFRGSSATRQLLRQQPTFEATVRGTGDLYFSSSRLIPEDARVVYPYSAVGKLFFSTGGSDFICSGAVISARIVATAGHCVFSAGRFHRNVLFVPAYHEGNAPFGVWAAAELHSTVDWMEGDDVVPNTSDFGMLVMEDMDGRRIGEVTGWLGFKTDQTSPNSLTLLGYPANLDRGEQMHQTTSSDWAPVDETGAILYGSDMAGGASGGPWVMNFGKKARGQNRGRNRLDNRIVGHSSFASSNPNFLVLGSSPLDRTYERLFNDACGSDPKNCQKKGKPKNPR